MRTFFIQGDLLGAQHDTALAFAVLDKNIFNVFPLQAMTDNDVPGPLSVWTPGARFKEEYYTVIHKQHSPCGFREKYFYVFPL